MRVYRLAAVPGADFQLIVKEHGVFPEGRTPRAADICKQTAAQGLASFRMQPYRAGRLHQNCAKQSVHIGAFLAAAGVCQIGEEESPLLVRQPGIADAVVRGGIRVETHVGPVGGQHGVGKPLDMDRCPAAQLVEEANANGVAQICPNHQRLHALIGLRDGLPKISQSLLPNSLGIFTEHIQQTVGVVIAILVVDNGQRDCLNVIFPDLSSVRIIR